MDVKERTCQHCDVKFSTHLSHQRYCKSCHESEEIFCDNICDCCQFQDPVGGIKIYRDYGPGPQRKEVCRLCAGTMASTRTPLYVTGVSSETKMMYEHVCAVGNFILKALQEAK